MEARFAKLGDVIEPVGVGPHARTLRTRLTTPEACAHGNELIASGRWRLVDEQEIDLDDSLDPPTNERK